MQRKALGSTAFDRQRKGFKKLFDAYRNDLYKFSLSMVYSEPYAEEIVREVFLNLWLKRKTTNPELSMKSYLFTITRNKREKANAFFLNISKYSPKKKFFGMSIMKE